MSSITTATLTHEQAKRLRELSDSLNKAGTEADKTSIKRDLQTLTDEIKMSVSPSSGMTSITTVDEEEHELDLTHIYFVGCVKRYNNNPFPIWVVDILSNSWPTTPGTTPDIFTKETWGENVELAKLLTFWLFKDDEVNKTVTDYIDSLSRALHNAWGICKIYSLHTLGHRSFGNTEM